MLVGGIARNFGEHGSSYRLGGGRDFVIEGDEYDSAFFDKTAKFLKYLPDIAVVNNVEFDHADIYADFDAVALAFRRLARLVPRKGLLLVGTDSDGARALLGSAVSRVQTFGTNEDAEWQAHDIEPIGASTRFKVRRQGAPWGAFEVPLVGAHNVRNALAAIAVAAEVGIDGERIADGLRTFAGVKRRLEVVGVADGVTVYDDFAHHPTAVAETLSAMRAANPAAPDLGGLRAAVRVVVPAGLSGRLREGLYRRRRGGVRAGLQVVAAGRRAAVDSSTRLGSAVRRDRRSGISLCR